MRNYLSHSGQNRNLTMVGGGFSLAFLLACSTSSLAQEGISSSRIDGVTLSSGGLAEIHRSAAIDGSTSLNIDIPLDQVDDFLKTLVIRDPSGRVGAMTLDGLSPVEETFRRLPFGPEQMGSLPSLAASLQGIRVRASSGGRTIEGAVLGVGRYEISQDDMPRQQQVLSVLADSGEIEALPLGTDAALTILDENMRDKLREAAAVSGRGRMDDIRTVEIELAGESSREIELTYLAPAPVWKTAYRLVTGPEGTARLQAWAVIENATGEDWDGVSLTLSSGAPVTLSQKLHQRYWHDRPEIPVTAGTTAPPRPDDSSAKAVGAGDGQSRVSRSIAPAAKAEPAMEMADMASFEPAAPANPAVAQEGLTTATYRIPSAVDLPAGRTVSIAFIDKEIPAERISLFQPERGDPYPIAALFLENDTGASLPPGLLTVYDEADGYVGDAQLTGLPAGENRMASFAADRKVEITTETRSQDSVEQIIIVDGNLRATRFSRKTTTYSIEGAPDAARTIIIEHPRDEGWQFSSDALDSETPTHHRLRAEIPADGSATVTAVSERREGETYALINTDADMIIHWSGMATDPETAAKLDDLAEIKQRETESRDTVEKIRHDIERASENQARIRENLGAVPPDSSLGQRYLKMLEEEENAISELDESLSAAEMTLNEQRRNVADFIRNL
ncbi:protein of unknown function [Paracoccus saliphilus]|uniref:DUF4139 domain-containing protein n=3 Tax=Paracoccus saliphilus TaxID=405559 RepID=A0AA45W3W4_9RHOB|nr:DUF4139 domain-containing protein [Paracoccus saliphilus]SIS80127.1 protein of unknown function [Paracoccus saliphilus]